MRRRAAPRQAGEGGAAGAFALAAGLGADAAVLVVLRVALALLGADTARRHACLEQRPCELRLEGCLARQHAARRLAGIGAVEVDPDAPDELADVRLAQAGVGARDAGLSAREALLDAAGERVAHT